MLIFAIKVHTMLIAFVKFQADSKWSSYTIFNMIGVSNYLIIKILLQVIEFNM